MHPPIRSFPPIQSLIILAIKRYLISKNINQVEQDKVKANPIPIFRQHFQSVQGWNFIQLMGNKVKVKVRVPTVVVKHQVFSKRKSQRFGIEKTWIRLRSWNGHEYRDLKESQHPR